MTTYTEVFGGGNVAPAEVSYIDYVLTAPLALVWPLETQPNSNLTAMIIDIDTASTGAFSLTLPPANQVGVGTFVIVNNKSAYTQIVYNNSGVAVATITSGAIYFIYLTNNTTTAGVWSAFQYGAATSAPNAAALAGPGLEAIGTQLAQDIVVLSTSTAFTVSSANQAVLINWTGSSGTITLPLTTVVGANFYFHVRNSGTSILTLTPTGSATINGASSINLNPGDSAFVVTDGTNWYTIGLGPILTNNFGFIVINVPSVISGNIVTLSGTQLNQVAYRFTGALTANTIVDLPAIVQQYWVDNETTGAYTLTFQVPTVSGGPTPAGATVSVGQGQRSILYTDGTNVLNANTQGISIPLATNQGGTGAITNSGAQANLSVPSTADAFLWGLLH